MDRVYAACRPVDPENRSEGARHDRFSRAGSSHGTTRSASPRGRRPPGGLRPPRKHASARTRTENPLIKSQLLYQLSYRGEGANCIATGLFCKRSTSGRDVLRLVVRCGLSAHADLPWHCLNFLPEPQGQGSLRPTTAAVGAAT